MAEASEIPSATGIPIEKMYLGDGLYLRFDGFQIWLETERDGEIIGVALDREVTHSFIWVAKKIYGDSITQGSRP